MNISEIYEAFEAVLGAYQDACNDSPHQDCEECGARDIPIDKEIVTSAQKALQELTKLHHTMNNVLSNLKGEAQQFNAAF